MSAPAEDLWEQIGGDLCICQRSDVSHWCEKCQQRIALIADALTNVSVGGSRTDQAPRESTESARERTVTPLLALRRRAFDRPTQENLTALIYAAKAEALRTTLNGACEHGVEWDVHCCGCHSGITLDSSKCICF